MILLWLSLKFPILTLHNIADMIGKANYTNILIFLWPVAPLQIIKEFVLPQVLI